MNFRRFFVILAFLVTMLATAFSFEEKVAKVRVNVTPSEAYIFLDGQPYTHRSHTLRLTPGEYTIGVYNYGFTPQVQKLTLKAGDNPEINARLTPVPAMVKGPWGRIQIEGNPNDKAAVFLNGITPEFFVGHIDEMNNDVLAEQRLVVPTGSYQMFIINPKETKPFWSGAVEVRANERVIVDIAEKENTRKYEPWHRGSELTALKRFEAGSKTATIAVAPVKASFLLDRKEINCGEPVKLTWTSADAAQIAITANGRPIGELPLTGEQTFVPRQTTTYEFKAAGPGGVVTSEATVDVNTQVQTSLTPETPEIRFRKVGDKVMEQGSTTLKWSATNADAVHIQPLGLVTGTSGTETVTALPGKTDLGPVDEMQTYKITATNVCGGSDTSTASLHLTGAIEPEPAVETELPQTASPLPFIGLLGLVSLFSGFAIRGLRKNR